MLPVFYTPKMVTDSGSYSPSARKPELVMADWVKQKLDIKVLEPEPVTEEELCFVHDRKFVHGVLTGRVNNGFGNQRLTVARTLPWTTGSMVSAARHVLKHGGIACSPTSGFHHAGYASGSGFCTFNGLAVTAAVLHHERIAQRIGIIDFDMHRGDGTEMLLEQHHMRYVTHYTAGIEYHSRSQAKQFFRDLPKLLSVMAMCDVVLYQAGADPHIDDPLGGWLTTKQLQQRDRMVFEGLNGTPVVWNLAGGYQVEKDGSIPKVLEVHANTMKAALEVAVR